MTYTNADRIHRICQFNSTHLWSVRHGRHSTQKLYRHKRFGGVIAARLTLLPISMLLPTTMDARPPVRTYGVASTLKHELGFMPHFINLRARNFRPTSRKLQLERPLKTRNFDSEDRRNRNPRWAFRIPTVENAVVFTVYQHFCH